MAEEGQRFVALVDLDAFYCSVEMLEDPQLKGKPVLIGGSPDQRGVVAAASYEARAFGCHSAMPMSRAVRLCPDAVILRPRFTLYREYSQRVMDVLRRESPLVQQMSIDEAYVELTPVAADIEEAQGLAHRMQGRIRVEIGLPSSVGLAANRLVAKVACETGKPQGFVTVFPGDEEAFLAPLELRMLPGIGPKSAQRLSAAGFSTLGEVARAPVERVMAALGPHGAVTQERCRGIDPSPVETERETKSISAEETFAQDIADGERLRDEVQRLSERVVKSLVKHGMLARTVTVKLRDEHFHTITRSASREQATADQEIITSEALRLLETNWEEGTPMRLIGVGVSNLRLEHPEGQMPLEI